MKNKAAFIDRDGNLIHEVGYISSLEGIKFYKRSVKAVKFLKDHGYKIIVVTNQSGVARNYIPESFVLQAHKKIDRMLGKYGLKIDAYYYCPHHPTKAVFKRYLKDCGCRKPKLGMVKKAVKRFNIDLKQSFTIGYIILDGVVKKYGLLRDHADKVPQRFYLDIADVGAVYRDHAGLKVVEPGKQVREG